MSGKVGFYGDAPVSQNTSAALASLTGGIDEDDVARGKINEIINVLKHYNLLP